jgi:hypothetical protein
MIEDHAQEGKGFELPSPRLEYLARFTVDLVAPVWELGATSDLGRRRVIPIAGGSFAGPLLNGEILNDGADWQIVTADGKRPSSTGAISSGSMTARSHICRQGAIATGRPTSWRSLPKAPRSVPPNTISAFNSNSRRARPVTAGSIAPWPPAMPRA